MTQPTADASTGQTDQESIIWSATSLVLLPTIRSRLNTQLPELFRLLTSLQDLQAGAHIASAREAQYYVALHGVFHDAPEIAVGNWVLSLAAELISPGICQYFKSDDTMALWGVSWKLGSYNYVKLRPVPPPGSQAFRQISCACASSSTT